jgi:D-glycero-D-manno-heptose 1,7-bisphosphate phosphatase
MNRAIFLDRDNTLIHNDGDLGDPAGVKLIQGAASALASIQGLGYRVVVVTNQGGVARGKYTEADVEAVNAKVAELIKGVSGAIIDRFYYCPYHPEGSVEKYRRDHPWRKPQPGMILQAVQDLSLDADQCWMIGDQDRDIVAGAAAGLRTILLRPDAGEQPPLRQSAAAKSLMQTPGQENVLPEFVARNLIEAVRVVAQQRLPEGLTKARLSSAAAAREGAAPAEDKEGKGHPIRIPPPAAPAVKTPAPRPITPVPPRDLSAAREQVSSPPAAPAARAIPPVAPPPAAASVPAPGPADRAGDATPPPPVEHSLRQILQELRHNRQGATDLTYHGVLAIALQMIAVVCFLAAISMGLNNSDVFFRWLGVAIFIELATIALLLFRR